MCNDNNSTSTNCIDTPSSHCILWQGDSIPVLGINAGDSLTDIENAVANKFTELIDDIAQTNSKINVSGVTLCGELVELMYGKDHTIANLLQILIDYNCTLKDITTTLGVGNMVLDYKCLDIVEDPCSTDNSLDLQHTLQVLIDNFCSLKQTVSEIGSTITTTVNNTSVDLVTNMLATCQNNRIVSNGAAGSARRLTFRGFVPPFCPIPYVGPLDKFDNSGKGLDNDVMCGWFLCNGQNGTPDMRGRVPVCAVQGMAGGGLSPDVDPSIPRNASGNYSVLNIGGEISHLLNGQESGLRSHNHVVDDPKHKHRVPRSNSTGGGGSDAYDVSGGPVYQPGDSGTESVATGITIRSVADANANQYHENRMPYIATYYIMMIN